jgi:hypothetical protein
MQSLTDYQDLRRSLRAALLARDMMQRPGLSIQRRDQIIAAYVRKTNHIIEVLERLEFQKITPLGTRPTLAVLGDVLVAIGNAEKAMEGQGHGTPN